MWMAPPDDRLSLAGREVPSPSRPVRYGMFDPSMLRSRAHTLISLSNAGNDRMTGCYYKNDASSSEPNKPWDWRVEAGRDTQKG